MSVDVSGTLPRIRMARGLTQDELADKIPKIRRTDISAFENGKPVGHARLQRLADALGVSPKELGAPGEAADPEYQSLPSRQAELEAQVLDLTKKLTRLARRVRVLEQQEPPGSQGEGSAAK